LVLVFALGLAGMVAGCGASSTSGLAGRDAGIEATDGRSNDGKVIGVQMPSCEHAPTACDGTAVRACVDVPPGDGGVARQPGDVLELCDSACSLGRCTTTACAGAEGQDGLRGCRFYGVQVDNIDEDDSRNLMLLLSNATSMEVNARVEARDADGTWDTLMTAVIAPAAGTRIELNRPVRDVGLTAAGAYRVETDGPVLAVQIVSDDAERKARSSGGTVLRPAQALGARYLALTYAGENSATVAATPGSRGGAGEITIVATTDDTVVQLELSAAAAVVAGGGVLDPPPALYESPPMNEGDVLQVFSTAPEGDLTGTVVTSQMPIAVFSGNVFTTYGYDLSGSNGGDLATEQLPPTASWGVEYVGARLSPQAGCDPFFGTGVGLWRVIAAEDDTRVTISPAVGVSVDGPNLPTDLKFTLNAAGVQSFWTRGDLKPPTPADFVATATGPILLAQWLDCEPGLSWGVDGRLSGGDFNFNLPPGFDPEVIVVRQAGQGITLDGRPLADARFQFASPAQRYEVARLGAADLGPCDDALDRCEHHLVGAAFGVTWRGMDVVCSFAVTAPPAATCALPTAGCLK